MFKMKLMLIGLLKKTSYNGKAVCVCVCVCVCVYAHTHTHTLAYVKTCTGKMCFLLGQSLLGAICFN